MTFLYFDLLGKFSKSTLLSLNGKFAFTGPRHINDSHIPMSSLLTGCTLQRKLALNVMCLIKIRQTEVKIRDKSQHLSKEVSLNKYI